jgi:para-nitrobenzyl esterase
LSKGLFKRVIIESGFSGFLTAEETVIYKPLADKEAACQAAVTKAFGKEMTLQELRAIPAENYLTQKTADGKQTLYDALTGAASGFALDGYVFTKDSVNLMRPGAFDGIDVMIGGTSDEYTSLIGGETTTMSADNFDASMQKTYGSDYKKVYRPTNDLEAYRMYLRSMSDNTLQKYILSAEYSKAHNNDMNVYSYYFNHTPPGRNSDFYGSFHSSELWYTFSSLRDVGGQRYWTDADYSMANIISSYFANFIRSGNPNGNGLTKWEQCTAGTNGTFIRFHEGSAYSVTKTPYPSRDALNRKVVLKSYGMTEADIAK